MKIKQSELLDSKPQRIEVDGEGVCVARIGSEVFAIGDTCSHSDASLSEGEISRSEEHTSELQSLAYRMPSSA